MPEALTQEEQEALDEVCKAIANDLANGKSGGKIVKELVKQDWPKDAATDLVNNIEQAMKTYRNSPEGRRAMAGQYARHIGYGILWAVGGTVVTIGTYEAASPGGTYIVAWGAILFGVVEFLRGLFGWMKYSW